MLSMKLMLCEMFVGEQEKSTLVFYFYQKLL